MNTNFVIFTFLVVFVTVENFTVNDPEESKDQILTYACGDNGEKFWKGLRKCRSYLNEMLYYAITTCIPMDTPTIAEDTRQKICAHKISWTNMMMCYHETLMKMQNHTLEDLELTANNEYKKCVALLLAGQEVSSSLKDEDEGHDPHPYEDDEEFLSDLFSHSISDTELELFLNSNNFSDFFDDDDDIDMFEM